MNEALGLKDCISVRVLKIFVECDPSDAIYKGFRHSDGFYENFSRCLLEGILKEVPSIRVVEFDAWPGVKKDGDMIAGLLEAVVMHDKIIAWGPQRRWEEDNRQNLLDADVVNVGASKVVSRSLAVLA